MALEGSRRQYCSLHIIAVSVVAPIMRQAFERVVINEYVKNNLNDSALKCYCQVVSNLVGQVYFQSQSSRVEDDYQPVPLEEDNMMQVTTLDFESAKDSPKKQSISNRSKKHGSKISMISQMSENRTDKKLRPALKGNDSQLVPPGHQQPIEQEKDIVKIYRFKKQEEEKLRLLPPVVRVKHNLPKLGKGEKMFFDFEGNIGKIKEMKSSAFPTVVVDSEIQSKTKVNEKLGFHTNDDLRSMKIMMVNKINDKLGGKKSGRQHSTLLPESGRIQFSKVIDQKQMSSVIKMEAGIRMTFGGEVLQGEKNNNKEVLRRGWTSVPKQLQMPHENKKQEPKKDVTEINHRFKTEFEEEKLALSKVVQSSLRESKNRAKTQVKRHQQSAKKGISIENQSLKKQFLTEEDEANFKHIDLPTKLSILKQNGSKLGSLMDSKKRGLSLHSKQDKPNGDVKGDKELPNIFNYKLANKQLLREIRKKLNF